MDIKGEAFQRGYLQNPYIYHIIKRICFLEKRNKNGEIGKPVRTTGV